MLIRKVSKLFEKSQKCIKSVSARQGTLKEITNFRNKLTHSTVIAEPLFQRNNNFSLYLNILFKNIFSILKMYLLITRGISIKGKVPICFSGSTLNHIESFLPVYVMSGA